MRYEGQPVSLAEVFAAHALTGQVGVLTGASGAPNARKRGRESALRGRICFWLLAWLPLCVCLL